MPYEAGGAGWGCCYGWVKGGCWVYSFSVLCICQSYPTKVLLVAVCCALCLWARLFPPNMQSPCLLAITRGFLRLLCCCIRSYQSMYSEWVNLNTCTSNSNPLLCCGTLAAGVSVVVVTCLPASFHGLVVRWCRRFWQLVGASCSALPQAAKWILRRWIIFLFIRFTQAEVLLWGDSLVWV